MPDELDVSAPEPSAVENGVAESVIPVSELPLEGVAHVPSPRQNVDEDALVPPFKLATGRFPVTPVDNGKPVQLVSVPEVGVPKTGVTSVGEVDKTLLPDPVEVVTPVPPLATGRVPVTPVVSGSPVQLVSVPEVGVPNKGVTKVGEVASTLAPDPVEVVTPVPPLATGSVPVTPVVKGSPVALVNTAAEGVPKAGVTSVGELDSTLLPEPVEVVTPVPPDVTGRADPSVRDVK